MRGAFRAIGMMVSLAVSGIGLSDTWADNRPILKVSTVAIPPLVTIEPHTDYVSGLAVEAVRRMAGSCGADTQFIVPPSWSRAFAMAREGTADALIPANYSAERAEYFDFHPHALLDLGPTLMVLESSDVQRYEGLKQLRGKRIAIQQNILLEPAFDAFIRGGDVQLTIRANATALVEELLTGQVDYIADSKAVLEHYLGETGVLKRVRTLEPSLGAAPQYIAFSKKRAPTFAADTALYQCLQSAKP